MAIPGTASRIRATSSRYCSRVYWRPIRFRVRLLPAWTGRWRCSHTFSFSAKARISLGVMCLGWEVVKRIRPIPRTRLTW